MRPDHRKIIRKILKTFAWIIISVTLLLIVTALVIRIPAVQTWITRQAVGFLETQIGTEVSLGSITVSFPKSIVIERLYLEDQKGDTLLFAGKLSFDTDLWALTRNEVRLNSVGMENIVAFVQRPKHDSSFNFTYILETFAGDTTSAPTTGKKEWTIGLETLAVENFRLLLEDHLLGNFLDLSLGNLEVNMREFDPANSVYAVNDVILADTRLALRQTHLSALEDESETARDSAASTALSFEDLQVENIDISYEHAIIGQRVRVRIGDFRVEANKIDLPNQEINLRRVTLSKSVLGLYTSRPDSLSPEKEPAQVRADTTAAYPWSIRLSELQLDNNTIEYTDMTQPRAPGVVDFNHLLITALQATIADIAVDGQDFAANLKTFSLKEQSGFHVQSLRGSVALSRHEARINDLLLATGNSRLNVRAFARYPSLGSLSTSLEEVEISAEIQDTYLGIRDIMFFDPSLRDSLPLRLAPNTRFAVQASVHGPVDDLEIAHLILGTLAETHLEVSGAVKGLPNPERLRMDIAIDRFQTTRADLQTILPDSLLPDSINLPEWLALEARYRGSLEKAAFESVLTSDAGSIRTSGDMNLDTTSASHGVNIALIVNDFDAGLILGQPDSIMDKLHMTARFNADGLSLSEMEGKLNAHVDYFDYKGYRYRDLQLNGNIRDQVAALQASMSDRNLDFDIGARYDFSRDVPRYVLDFDLRNADFQALNLSATPIRGRGMLAVDLATADFKILNGSVGIRKVAVFNGDDLYMVDSLLFASIDQEGRSEIAVDSDLLQARFAGSMNIFALPSLFREYFNTYYFLHDSLQVNDTPPQHFNFSIEFRNTDLITNLLVPELSVFKPGPIRGEFDSESKKLDIRVDIDAIQYANIGIRSLDFSVNSDPSDLRYDLRIDEVLIDSTRIDGVELTGEIADNAMATALTIRDSLDQRKYVLAGTLFSGADTLSLALAPVQVLNYENWSVPDHNFMHFRERAFSAQNVALENGPQRISVHADGSPGNPVSIDFRQVNLEYLTSMVAAERPASGLLQGKVNLFPSPDGLQFTSGLSVTEFAVRDVPWGDIDLQVSRNDGNQFLIEFALSGSGNDIDIKGSYTGGESASVDVTANVNRFSLPALQPLVARQVLDLKGTLTGQIRILGSPDRPDVNGGIHLSNTAFFSTYLNTNFTIDDEAIAFTEEGIVFNNFEIGDRSGNKARLDGSILTRDYTGFAFAMDLTAENFRLLDTKEGDNDLFYGKVGLKINAKIRGNMETPAVDADIGLAEDSNLTYIVPQSEASALEAEGIVRFVDKSFEGDPFMMRIEHEVADTIKSGFSGIDLTARIELTDRETFTIVIDPLTQDQLSTRGNATLTLQIDPTGDMNLTGRFEIEEGTYSLSFYKFVKREFSIERGSTITWLGDPLNAQMDVRAIYNIETSPVELFANQLAGTDPNEANQYKQRLPFMVYLILTGELLQPEVSFRLDMPMEERNAFGGNVYARLQDINTRESDLNKQVFALLILKRFISDDPFENRAGGGLESTARRSVSKILSEQLNRLSENIRGVELSFDIKSYEDYTTGQAQGQTELELGVSKSLFNDRLVVKLSGNIDIEGENTNRNATDYIGDLALEYKITPDGRFRITGFRNSNYDMIDGELIETGAGFIYVKDYNALSELFKANATTKNQKR